jgi:hypothetical protein
VLPQQDSMQPLAGAKSSFSTVDVLSSTTNDAAAPASQSHAPATAEEDNDDDDTDLLDELLGNCIGKPASAATITSSRGPRAPNSLRGTVPPFGAQSTAVDQPAAAPYGGVLHGAGGKGAIRPALASMQPEAAAAAGGFRGGLGAAGQAGSTVAGVTAREPPPAAAPGQGTGCKTGKDALSLEDELEALLGIGGESKVSTPSISRAYCACLGPAFVA